MPAKDKGPAQAERAPDADDNAASSKATKGRSRIPRPDSEAQKKEIEAINAKIEALKKKQAELNEQINGTSNIKGNYESRRAEAREKIDALTAEKNKVQDEFTKTLDQIKSLQSGIKKKVDDAAKDKDKHGYKSIEDVDKAIRELEKQLESGSVKLIEEKRIVSDISNLKKIKKSIENAAGQQTLVDADRQQIDTLRKKLDEEIAPKRDAIRKQLDEARAAQNEIVAAQKNDMGGFNELINARKAIKAELDAEYGKIRELRAEHKKIWDEFKAFQDQEYQRQREAQKVRRREEARARLEKEVARELEDSDIPAYTNEIFTCTALIDYLRGLTKSSAAVAANAAAASAAAARPVESALPAGAMVLQRKEDRDDDYLVMGSQKKKGKKGAAAAADPGKRAIRFDFEMINQFQSVKVDIPTAYAELDKTIEALEARRQFYKENQASKTAEQKAAAQKKLAELKAKIAEETGEDLDDAKPANGDAVEKKEAEADA